MSHTPRGISSTARCRAAALAIRLALHEVVGVRHEFGIRPGA